MSAQSEIHRIFADVFNRINDGKRIFAEQIFDGENKLKRITGESIVVCRVRKRHFFARLVDEREFRLSQQSVRVHFVFFAVKRISAFEQPSDYGEKYRTSARPVLFVALPEVFDISVFSQNAFKFRSDNVDGNFHIFVFYLVNHRFSSFSSSSTTIFLKNLLPSINLLTSSQSASIILLIRSPKASFMEATGALSENFSANTASDL